MKPFDGHYVDRCTCGGFFGSDDNCQVHGQGLRGEQEHVIDRDSDPCPCPKICAECVEAGKKPPCM